MIIILKIKAVLYRLNLFKTIIYLFLSILKDKLDQAQTLAFCELKNFFLLVSYARMKIYIYICVDIKNNSQLST